MFGGTSHCSVFLRKRVFFYFGISKKFKKLIKNILIVEKIDRKRIIIKKINIHHLRLHSVYYVSTRRTRKYRFIWSAQQNVIVKFKKSNCGIKNSRGECWVLQIPGNHQRSCVISFLFLLSTQQTRERKLDLVRDNQLAKGGLSI